MLHLTSNPSSTREQALKAASVAASRARTQHYETDVYTTRRGPQRPHNALVHDPNIPASPDNLDMLRRNGVSAAAPDFFKGSGKAPYYFTEDAVARREPAARFRHLFRRFGAA